MSVRARINQLLAEAAGGEPASCLLDEAFDWQSTAEGFAFWDAQCDRLERGLPLSDEAKTALRKMIGAQP